MTRLLGCVLLFVGFAASDLMAQGLSTSALPSSTKPQRQTAANSVTRPAAEPKEERKDPIKQAFSESKAAKGQPITTEIFADEAFFDSANHIGIFTGHVVVNDPRFNVQSDKLTIYLSKNALAGKDAGEPQPSPGASPNQALEKAVAEGNVGVVRERPDDKGGAPVRSVGRGEMAVYTTSDGKVELRGTPRVQSGMNTHVATSPDTVMVLDQGGQLTTKGPSRTEIRQEAKPGEAPAAAAPPAPAPAATPKR